MRIKNTPKSLHLAPSVLHRHVMKQTTPAMRFGPDVHGRDARSFRGWQGKLRRKVYELVGLDRMPMAPADRGPLNVRSIWKLRHELGTIEKIAFTAEPYADVLAYVCLPKNARPPHKWFICVQGHSTGAHVSIARQRNNESRRFEVEGDRDFGLGCMRRGMAALCIEQRSFGERDEFVQKQRASHPCHDATMHALMLGRTLIGERLFDVDRGIDYLETRDDVEMESLGIMGNSGGGTISLFAAALLPRIRYAMPSCYFCTFADSIMNIYHCMDNYIPHLLEYAEMSDVMGVFAPRPVTIVAGKTDPIFPIKGVRKAFRDLKDIYAAAGAPDACKLVVGPEGHRFYADLAWPKMLGMM